jgi:hypothetical protein
LASSSRKHTAGLECKNISSPGDAPPTKPRSDPARRTGPFSCAVSPHLY